MGISHETYNQVSAVALLLVLLLLLLLLHRYCARKQGSETLVGSASFAKMGSASFNQASSHVSSMYMGSLGASLSASARHLPIASTHANSSQSQILSTIT